MTAIRERARKLQALIDGGSTEGERQAAQLALERLMAQYDLSATDLNEKEASVDLRYSTFAENKLLWRLAYEWGCTPYDLARRRKLKELRIEGPESAVGVVKALYESLLQDMRERVELFSVLLAESLSPLSAEARKRMNIKQSDREWDAADYEIAGAALRAAGASLKNGRLGDGRPEGEWHDEH